MCPAGATYAPFRRAIAGKREQVYIQINFGALYDASQDAQFLPEDIFSQTAYVPDLTLEKGSQYLEVILWIEYGVSNITMEMTTTVRIPQTHSAKCITIAVATYINFIIQNALFFLQTPL